MRSSRPELFRNRHFEPAVIVTCVPATGLLLLDVTMYLVAEPGLKVAVSAALLFKTALHGLVVPEHVEELRPA